MTTRTLMRRREVIFREGKPVGVILPIDTYKELLERVEDVEDLKMLKGMRRKPLSFVKFDDFIKEYHRA